MSIVRRKQMGLKIQSRGGIRSYALRDEITCTKSPNVDTPQDIALFMRQHGIFDGATLLIDPTCTCTDIEISTENAQKKPGANGGAGLWYWTVPYTFSAEPGQDPQNNQKEDPTERFPDIAIRLDQYTLPASWDANGDPIANSAHDPIRIDDQRARTVISIDRVLNNFDPDLLADCRPRRQGGSVGAGFLFSRNQNSWNPFGSYSAIFNDYQVDGGKALIRAMTCGIHHETNRHFASFHAEVLVDDDFHRDRPWDVGFRGWIDEDDEELGNPTVQLIDDRSGMYPAAAIPLDGAGRALDMSKTSKMVALQFQRFPEKDWATVPALAIP